MAKAICSVATFLILFIGMLLAFPLFKLNIKLNRERFYADPAPTSDQNPMNIFEDPRLDDKIDKSTRDYINRSVAALVPLSMENFWGQTHI